MRVQVETTNDYKDFEIDGWRVNPSDMLCLEVGGEVKAIFSKGTWMNLIVDEFELEDD